MASPPGRVVTVAQLPGRVVTVAQLPGWQRSHVVARLASRVVGSSVTHYLPHFPTIQSSAFANGRAIL
jgi:hypothetical protein